MRHPVILAAAAAAALTFATPARAGIWTPINSGTTDSITAISDQSDAKLFFATSSGKIFQENADGSGSTQRLSAPGVVFNDIAFSPSGNVGLAVGSGTAVYRSTNAGQTWAKVAGPFQTFNNGANTGTSADFCGTYTGATKIAFNGDFGGVSFKDDSTAYVIASSVARGSVQKTTDGGATFTEASRTATGCNVNALDFLTDVHAIAGSDSVFFVDRDFGRVYFSSNGLSGAAAFKHDSVNCFTGNPRLGIDDGDASKVFVSDTCDGTLSYQFSSNGGTTFSRPDFSSGTSPKGASDVAVKSGNALFVGAAGGIYQTNGLTAIARPADGALATAGWRAVGMASAASAVAGGDGGVLVKTAQANAPLDITAPAGDITGPFTVQAGVPATYSVTATDNPGGTGVDPASITWSAPGIPNTVGNPVRLTFATAGTFVLTVTFKDFAGNVGTDTQTVTVGAGAASPKPTSTFVPVGTKNPLATKTSSVAGGSIKLAGPKTCVPVGQTFSATLSFKKATRKKKGSLVKVSSVAFSIDGKTAKSDKKAPFTQKLSVKSYTPSSTHTLKARATIKVRHGKSPKKSIATTFQVCGA